MASFKLLSSIVDDVNNQTVLRQTQLIIEGTAKMNIEEDSFGTIPYLGTFLTDLNVIDARYPNFVPSPQNDQLEDVKDPKIKLINIEKCAKQFEILTQVQLLQKNVLASLYSILRKNHFDRHADSSRFQMESNQTQQLLLVKPCIPQVSIVFKTWFHDKEVSAMTDKQW